MLVLWLQLQIPNAGGPGSISGQGTRSHDAPKTQRNQINKKQPQVWLTRWRRALVSLSPRSRQCPVLSACASLEVLHSWAASLLPTGLWNTAPALPSLSHNRAVTMTFPLLHHSCSALRASIPKLHFLRTKPPVGGWGGGARRQGLWAPHPCSPATSGQPSEAYRAALPLLHVRVLGKRLHTGSRVCPSGGPWFSCCRLGGLGFRQGLPVTRFAG